MTFKEFIAKNISDQIKYSGKTQAQIAEDLGVLHTAISQYVNGYTQPTLENLIKLCKSLNCGYEDILGKLED